MIVIPPAKNIDIIVRTIKRPLPSRIYEQIQSLTMYDDVLVQYEILNLGRKKRRLKIETEIMGFTNRARKVVFVHGINNKANKKVVVLERQCPRLKRGVLAQIVNLEKATMLCMVTDEDTKDTLYEETFNIDILPHDQFVFRINDVSSNSYNLATFIGAWIYPNDGEGLLDRIRVGAADFHPDKAMGISNADNPALAEIDVHVGAIYEYLSKVEKLKYVSQPFTSKPLADSQRIVLPEQVLKNKAGNCIDLTVLFASLLEGLGIYSLIFFTPDHAFIGWGNSRRTEEMLFLETTALGRKNYEEAKEIAKHYFKEKFLFIGSDNPLPNNITYHSKGCQIIDLKEVRSSGIAVKNV